MATAADCKSVALWATGFDSLAIHHFARLVAEDCARWVDGNAAQCSGITAELMHSNADAIRARYAETKET